MCRLFAITGGSAAVSATFWLLDAPDSLAEQSHKNPDGTGLGWFDAEGQAHVDKAPIAGFEDAAFASAAREVHARTIIAHVRYATAGAHTMENTHPFEQDGRLFGHNGVLADLARIEERLGADAALIRGQTDSERLFTLITHEIRQAGGDVHAGITTAVRWLAAEIELFSINFVLTTATELWAFRYPEGNELHVLERAAGPGALDHRTADGPIRVHSTDCADTPTVVVASEPMDDDPRWSPLASGELLHVDEALRVTRERVVDHPPAHLQVLTPKAAVAQAPS
jgi:glutamine amidotransferase